MFFSKIKDPTFRQELWQSHKESLFFLCVFVLGFSFLPVWLTLFGMLLTQHWESIGELWNSGGLFIYSAALLGSAIYMMHGYPKKRAVSLIGVVYIISWFLTLFSAAGFVIATIPNILSSQSNIELPTVALTSSIFVVCSLIIIYYAHYYDSRNLDTDKQSRRNIKNMMDRLS